MASRETEPPPPGPKGKARHRSSVFIALFVGLQFVVPLTYLSREDGADERFTWRSFTEAEAPSCEISATLKREDGAYESLELEKLIHPDWFAYMAQGRRAVVDAFLKKQCEAGGVLSVELVNDCDDEGGVREYTLRCGGERSHETVRTAAR